MDEPFESNGHGFWNEGDFETGFERFQTLVNAVDDGIYQLDTAGNFVAVNDAIVETTGYSREELLGEHVSILLQESDVARLEREIRSRLDADGEIQAEGGSNLRNGRGARRYPGTTFDMVIQTVEDKSVPCELRFNLLQAGDAFNGTVGTVRIVQEDSRDHDQLASVWEAYESITAVVDEADVGVFVLDDDFTVAWIDETIERYFGVDRAAVIGRDKRKLIDETIRGRVADPDEFAETVLATYDDNSYVEHFECQITAGTDRKERWLEHRSKPIETGRYAGGRVELYYDISDRKYSEEALQETEQRFESLVDAVEEYAIFMLDPKGTIVSWNEGARQIKEYTADEIIGEHFSVFYTADDQASRIPEQNLAEAVDDGSTEDEGWRVRNDGTRFWANVTLTAIRDEKGSLKGYAKVTRDMTDRRERERELQRRREEAEKELEEVFQRVSDAFYALDEEFRFTHVNERAEELLQHTEEALLGQRLWDVFPETTDEEEIWDSFHTAMETQEPQGYERYFEPLDFWVEATLYPSETGISVYFRDATERIERERALEESERRYRTLAECFPNGIVTLFDDDLTYTLAAGRAFDDLPVTPKDVEGRTPREAWGDDVADELEPALRAVLDGDEETVEVSYAGRDWRLHAVPVTDERGDVFAGMTMAQDVTEHKEREQRLEELINKLEQSNERLEQFAYAASHDLQEPLRMVSSYLQLVESRYADELDEDAEEFIEFAVDGAERMREMIEGLLEYSRVETRDDPLEPIDLEDVFEDAIENLEVKIRESGAEITADPLPRVRGDAGQLQQVFQNLLDNAIEYSGDEPPRIHVEASREAVGKNPVGREAVGQDAVRQNAVGHDSVGQNAVERDAVTRDENGRVEVGQIRTGSDDGKAVEGEADDRKWVLSIHDEGVGIDVDDQERIFEVFQRLHSRGEHSGTGIGLALCQRIVERHGGEIWVDSEPGEGTTFSVTLEPAETVET